MLKSNWCLVLGMVVVGMLAVSATARDVELKNVAAVDEGAISGGTLMGGAGVTPPEGDVVYRSANLSGYYYRPYPGYRDYDDIHLEPHGKYENGELVKYQITVFGSTSSGSDAGQPFDVTTCLYEDDSGDPAVGSPVATPIPGSCCDFTAVPTGLWTLECVVSDGIAIPQGLWMSFETSTDNSGWTIADMNDCPNTGPPGYSEDFWAEEDLTLGGFTFFYFGGCPANPQASFGGAMIVAKGQPWACCDMAAVPDPVCSNVMETACDDLGGSFSEDVLCGNLPQPCSMAGACCDVPSGVCEDTFEVFCDGHLQAFHAGQLCVDVDCPVPDNVPTLTQWGMIVLVVLLLIGLTIKFGRRRTVKA